IAVNAYMEFSSPQDSFYVLAQYSCGSIIYLRAVKVKVHNFKIVFIQIGRIFRVIGISTHLNLLSIRKAVSIGIRIGGIRIIFVDLIVIAKPVAVGIDFQRVCAVFIYFFAVGQAVTVSVGFQRVGAVRINFFSVGESIAVGVGFQRISSILINLFAVGQAVAGE